MNPERWGLRTRLLAAVIGGGLLLLAFPPADNRFAAWVAMVPLLLAIRGATARAGLLCGLAAGTAFFGGVLYWIAAFGFVAWTPLVLVMALSWGIFGWFGAWASHHWAGRLVGTPLLFAALEMVRARYPLGGFAWGLLGTTQHGGAPLLPIARVGGVFVLGAAVLLINASAAEVVSSGRVVRRALTVVLAAGLATGASYLPLGLAGPVHGRIEIAAVQVNVRTYGLQRGQRRGDEDVRILQRLADTTAELADSPPDLVVWPENAVDHDPFVDPEIGAVVSGSVRDVGSPFLVGAILDVDDRRFRNSLLLYEADGRPVARYDKQHLVPFGEYVPWPSLRTRIGALEQVPFDGVPGGDPVIFDVAAARVGGVICFESTFPELVREFVEDGAEVLVVATNNASFGRSTAAAEHLAQSKIRAVEHGRIVVHAAISGSSAFVMPDGTVHQRTALFEPAVIRRPVELTRALTPYTQFGDALELGVAGGAALAAFGGLAGVFGRRRARREQRAMEEFDWGPASEPSDARPPSPEAAE